ncbi:MAG: PEP-CTERM sorting domain-containing protein [Thiobacillus sp.]|nr:PEP-CTERM sorting domain-containing protein [Thiobacillus sp.]
MKLTLISAAALMLGMASAQAATFTLLPTSTLAVTGTVSAGFTGTYLGQPFSSTGSGALAEQAPGSLTTTLSGTIDVSLSGSNFTFSSNIAANNNGSWMPTLTPANFGLTASVFMDSTAPFPDFTMNVVGAVSGITTNLSGAATLIGAYGNQSFAAPLGGFITSGVVNAVATPTPLYLPPTPVLVPLSNIAVTGIANGTLVSDGLTETLTLPFAATAQFSVPVLVNANGVLGTATLAMTRHATGNIIAVRAVPEPGAYLMMLAGLGMIGLAIHRRKRMCPHS